MNYKKTNEKEKEEKKGKREGKRKKEKGRKKGEKAYNLNFPLQQTKHQFSRETIIIWSTLANSGNVLL